MCGISGFIDFKCESSENILKSMNRTMVHRGPDGEGYYFENIHSNYQIGFGHRRLSIIDLSSAGTQPMHYLNYSILLNGEIYNYKEIRKDLEKLGHTFVGHSDTEVVLHAFIEWGEPFIDKLIGMFAIVIFNKDKNEIFACRDRAGAKPFYYYWHNDLFLFTSELKAFHEHPNFLKKVNHASVASFLQYGYVPAPNCIFNNCFKLLPGYVLNFNLNTKTISTRQYWNVYDAYNKPKLNISFSEAKQETEKILTKAFEYRMVADVPVGVFLSGGYDSASVAAILQANSTEKLNTYTIGVGEEKLNEAPFAKEVAKKLGTDHTEYYCQPTDILEMIDDLPFYYDEPFGDSSALPTMLVCKMARKNVTVALSADAGDEIFAGYNRYDYVSKYLNKIQKIPSPIRKASASLLQTFPPNKIPILGKHPLFAYRYGKILGILKNPDTINLMNLLCAEFQANEVKTLINQEYNSQASLHSSTEFVSAQKDDISIMQAIDYQTYLTDDIMQKVDRASMSASLEGREPFLDQHIIEWVAQLPTNFKYNNGVKKYLLKEIVHQYIPKEMMDRPKMGFAIPVSDWLQNELLHYVHTYISEESLNKYNILNTKQILKIKSDFLNGRKDLTIKMWYILMFQMWCAKWM